jgi:RimJ/RimL family protein N-acetyltransferase
MTNPINDGRVLLRDVIADDLPAFYDHQIDPVAVQMAAFPARELAAFMSHWAQVMADESIVKKTILWNGQVVGHIVCFSQSGERDVGYWLGRDFWGKGIASLALREFLKKIETRPLYAHVARHNLASARVLEKCGFKIISERDGEFTLMLVG